MVTRNAPGVARKGVVGAAACALVLAPGCAGGRTPAPTLAPTTPAVATASATAAPSSAAPAGTPAPLSGVPVSDAVARRPVLAVAVGSDPAPRGLDRADVIIEEITTPIRYLALYQSRDASVVGPITQTRPVDAQLLPVARPAVAYSGGPSGFVQQLQRSGVMDLGYLTHPASYQDSASGLFAATATLYALTDGAASSPPLLTFAAPGQSFATKGAVPAREVVVTMPGAPTQKWTYVAAARAWQRDDPGIRVSNLILQEVPYKQVELRHGKGVFVASARALGSGRSTVLSGPAAVGGQWLRPGPRQVTNYLDAADVPVRLAPGSTWVVLVPPGSNVARR
jgi:hypothetical protein